MRRTNFEPSTIQTPDRYTGPSGNPTSAKSRTTSPSRSASAIGVDCLRGYAEFVRELGGKPDDLLALESIDPALFERPDETVQSRAIIRLLERTAAQLDIADFGLQLAALQGGGKICGPIEIAMRYSPDLRAALNYCVDHIRSYSPGIRISLEGNNPAEEPLLRLDFTLGGSPERVQAVEYFALSMSKLLDALTGSEARSREIWLVHAARAPMAAYRKHFGTTVRFSQPFNAIFLRTTDLDQRVVTANSQLFDLVKTFISTQYPATNDSLSARVRMLLERGAPSGAAGMEEIAAALGLHSRTLQRHLREEGTTFDEIKDDIRRDAALVYLRQTDMPLSRIATLLGYSEQSVLSRSCYRWFGISPNKLRTSVAK